MTAPANPDPARNRCAALLIDSLHFEGSWATLSVPESIELAYSIGFAKSTAKHVLQRWIAAHPSHVSTITIPKRMSTHPQGNTRDSLRKYLPIPNRGIVSHIRIHQDIIPKLRSLDYPNARGPSP